MGNQTLKGLRVRSNNKNTFKKDMFVIQKLGNVGKKYR